ncbi:unnamed protein product [Macrosiphum euphorbiae]|uniref:Uncharacterized protein n=1 Tax=Macrosiphum euphorbiae TaxID=13131 RepID=A0AAV0XVN6_9HEMI|nr:unnamed protein product [Macrosiphum euphorbiae]
MEYGIADLKDDLNGSDWSITARVLNKSDILTFNNGKRFTTILFDKNSEIRATAFGDNVDRLFDQLQEKNVYNIKNGEIKKADKAYNNTKHDYEIIFNSSTIIKTSGVTDIPSYPQLKTIENVFTMDLGTFIVTIGVITEIEDPQEKNGRYKLRNIILADSTGSVAVTLWDTKATDFNANEGDIMSIIGGKVIDYKNVKKINVTLSSKVEFNPCWKETSDLQNWYKEFEKKKPLNPSQVSVGSQELHMFESSQSTSNKTEYERFLEQNKIDEDLMSKEYWS